MVGNNPPPNGIMVSKILLFVQRLFVWLSGVDSIASSLLICACSSIWKKRDEKVARQSGTAQTSSQEAPPGGAPTPSVGCKV